jgi:hypothetical protein
MTARRGRGRPSKIWRAEPGWKFFEAVALTRYKSVRPITNGSAIRIVLEQPEFARLKKYANGSTDYLQKQLLDAANSCPWMSPTTRELIGRGTPIWNEHRKSTFSASSDGLILMLALAWELEQHLLEEK